MPEIHVINDLQYGSCAKRLFTEYYANQWNPDTIISNALPNSGGYDSAGDKWSAIPIGYPCKMLIAPGSAINIDMLNAECEQLKRLYPKAEVIVHENAAVVTKDNEQAEAEFSRIGSTMTGGMRALVAKMERDPEAMITAKHYKTWIDAEVVDTNKWLYLISQSERILGLCAQGHSLSINFGFYPYTTSRNTSPAQWAADAGINPMAINRIIGCLRTWPIRVANRYGKNGNQIGWSGPCYDDQKEITWEDIGVPPEITSISKKVRRVFSFSGEQLAEAIQVTGTTDIFLGFLNYVPIELQQMLASTISLHRPVRWVGVDKTINDIYRIEDYKWDRSWV